MLNVVYSLEKTLTIQNIHLILISVHWISKKWVFQQWIFGLFSKSPPPSSIPIQIPTKTPPSNSYFFFSTQGGKYCSASSRGRWEGWIPDPWKQGKKWWGANPKNAILRGKSQKKLLYILLFFLIRPKIGNLMMPGKKKTWVKNPIYFWKDWKIPWAVGIFSNDFTTCVSGCLRVHSRMRGGKNCGSLLENQPTVPASSNTHIPKRRTTRNWKKNLSFL